MTQNGKLVRTGLRRKQRPCGKWPIRSCLTIVKARQPGRREAVIGLPVSRVSRLEQIVFGPHSCVVRGLLLLLTLGLMLRQGWGVSANQRAPEHEVYHTWPNLATETHIEDGSAWSETYSRMKLAHPT